MNSKKKTPKIDSTIQDMFRATFEEAPLPVGIASVDGVLIKVNRAYAEFLGYEIEELQGMSIREISHPEEIERDMTRLTQLGSSATSTTAIEKRYRKKNGDWLWASLDLRMVKDEKGNPKFAVAFIKDVTVRKKEVAEIIEAKSAIERSQKFLETVLGALPVLVSYVDTDLIYRYVNPTYEKWFGVKSAEIVGKHVTELVGVKAYKVIEEALQKVFQGQRIDLESVVPFKVGGTRVVQVTYIPNFAIDKSGKESVIGFISVVQDMTEAKEAQKKLIQASKMSSLGEMAGGIAHEINNPLAIIQGKISQIYRKLEAPAIDPKAVTEDLLRIEKTTDRIAKIVKGLRLFSRDSGQDPLTPILLTQVIEETLELCKERFKKKDTRLQILNDAPEVQVMGRPSQISQVLMNLIGNALDAIEELPKRWIDIHVQIVNRKVQIIVTDSGSGIAEDIIEKLMTPFFTTKGVGKGTGLGLSISKGIMESHFGELRYERSQNTRFVIELPVHVQKSETAKTKNAA